VQAGGSGKREIEMNIEVITWSNGSQWTIKRGKNVLVQRVFAHPYMPEENNLSDCGWYGHIREALWRIVERLSVTWEGGSSGSYGRANTPGHSDFQAAYAGVIADDDPDLAYLLRVRDAIASGDNQAGSMKPA
jgi:hypothetical protein